MYFGKSNSAWYYNKKWQEKLNEELVGIRILKYAGMGEICVFRVGNPAILAVKSIPEITPSLSHQPHLTH